MFGFAGMHLSSNVPASLKDYGLALQKTWNLEMIKHNLKIFMTFIFLNIRVIDGKCMCFFKNMIKFLF